MPLAPMLFIEGPVDRPTQILASFCRETRIFLVLDLDLDLDVDLHVCMHIWMVIPQMQFREGLPRTRLSTSRSRSKFRSRSRSHE